MTTPHGNPTGGRLTETLIDIPGYDVKGKIGAGGMGTVYYAIQLSLGRARAIKSISPSHTDRPDYPDLVRRLEREARSAAALDHECIVKVIEYVPGERPAIVMDFVDGANLKDLLTAARTPPSLDIAMLILWDVCRALEHAHGRGVVHRDVKPANITVTREGTDSRAKLMDFGLARFGEESSDLTRTGAAMGTPHYMSPEQARGRSDVGTRSDVFSLGVVAYELFSGTKPFTGDSWIDLAQAILTADPTPLAESSPDLPPELPFLVQSMLQKKPEDRPVIGIARETLEGLINDRALRSQRSLLSGWAASQPPMEVTPLPPSPPTKPPARPPESTPAAGSTKPPAVEAPTVVDPPRVDSPGVPPPAREAPTVVEPPPMHPPGGTIIPPPPQPRGRLFALAGAVVILLFLGVWAVKHPSLPGVPGGAVEPLTCTLTSDPPTSEPLSVDGRASAWGQPLALKRAGVHSLVVGRGSPRRFMINVPEGGGDHAYVVRLQQGVVEAGSSGAARAYRYRLTAQPASLTITAMSPPPVEPGYVNLMPGQALEIDATTPSGEVRHFRFSAPAGESAGMLLIDFSTGSIRSIPTPAVDL